MSSGRARLGLLCTAVVVLLVPPPPSHAAFHEILVREVYAGAGDNDSYVVLQAYSGGQNFLSGHSVTAYNASGTAIGTFTFSGSVGNGQNQMTVLVADTEYAAGFPSGPAPDGTDANFNLSPAGGAVCWTGLDCVAWGSFTTTTSPSSGAPADPAGIPAGMALRRTIAPSCSTLLELADDTNVSATDLQDATPNPRANSSAIVEMICAPPTAPQTTIGNPKPPARTNSTEAQLVFTATPAAGAGFECKLDSAPSFASCTSPATYTELAGGSGTSHTFQVRAVHPTNGTDPSPASHTWIVDTAAPTTTLDSSPVDPSPGASAAFTFHASETASFQCSLVPVGDPDSFAACASGKTYTSLADGEYTFKVRATDQATNLGPATSYNWEVDNGLADTTPPQTTIDSKPPDPSPSSTAAFAYSSNEPNSTFACALDGGPFLPCPPAGLSYDGLGTGPHDFQVRAIDAAQNADPTPAGYSFTVVLAPVALAAPPPIPPAAALPAPVPQTTITLKPAVRSRDRTPTFRFGSKPPGAGFRCKVDRGAARACVSPFTTRPLAPGRHTIAVWAIIGRVIDPTPAKFSFKVLKP